MSKQKAGEIGTLALDFDGVICDGIREYFQASLRAADQIWPNLEFNSYLSLEPQFQQLRPIVTHGWEMPLLIWALVHGYRVEDLVSQWATIRQGLLDQQQLEAKTLGQTLDQVRDDWIKSDWRGWLNLHQFYPGIATQLQAWQKTEFPWVIVTTKETRFVNYLLAEAGLAPPPLGIYGKDLPLTKVEVLLNLVETVAQPIWFVEDRFEALLSVKAEPKLTVVELFLAAWGYNTAATRAQAEQDPRLRLLELDQFRQDFPAWIRH